MQRLPVESSDIISVGYDAMERLLEVEFNGGRVYQYKEVEPDVYDHFVHAESYGRYFYSSINGRYRYERVDQKNDTTIMSDGIADGIAFVTHDALKVSMLKAVCTPYDINIEQLDLPIWDIQAYDAEEAALAKAKQAHKLAGRPVVVEVTFWDILSLRGFPGAYMSAMTSWLKPEDFLRLLADKTDRTICRTDVLVYYDGSKRPKTCCQEVCGTVIAEARGQGSSIEQIVVMAGGANKTIAEQKIDTPQLAPAPAPIPLPGDAYIQLAKWLNMRRRFIAPKAAA